jgi:hypothetical protein
MTVKASGCSALIIATGLFVCFAGPSQAAEDAAATAQSEAADAPVILHKFASHGSRHWKRHSHRHSSKVALKSAADNKANATDDGGHSRAIPPAVADANAQLASADAPTSNAASAMSARANDILRAAPDKQADAQIVSADQLNEVDRALQEPTPPASTSTPPILGILSAKASAAPAVASRNESSAWDQTSLIGKVFIGFGALLTMASAARMFMA